MVAVGSAPHKRARHFVFFTHYEKIGFFATLWRAGRTTQFGHPGGPMVYAVRTTTRQDKPRREATRQRFGYDHRWWGEPEPPRAEHPSYWSSTRRPVPSLAFVAPLLLAYEVGVLWLGGGKHLALRTGADTWLRQGLATLGLTDHWLLPL